MQPFLDGSLSEEEVAEAQRHLDDVQLVREALQVRRAAAPLRARRGQRADVAGAEGEARGAAHSSVMPLMSMSPRGRARQQPAASRRYRSRQLVVILALILLLSGHWILGIVFGAAAVVAVLAFLQLRTVR